MSWDERQRARMQQQMSSSNEPARPSGSLSKGSLLAGGVQSASSLVSLFERFATAPQGLSLLRCSFGREKVLGARSWIALLKHLRLLEDGSNMAPYGKCK